EDSQALHLASTYLSFLHYAQTPSFRFHNFMAYDQTFLDKEGSEDSFGRTLLACGFALGSRVHENIKRVARELLDNSPVLQRSVRLRNPYVDPMSYLQVRLLRERRARPDDPLVAELVQRTVNGIAAGLQTTG
ncbi:MAG: phosphoenolpyruvate carboxylase, partial [Firmicutes bacterium]|nr:phosphoenolpyruvate carboxylase [Bacillota bacterium]